eukprot:SAG25_NODE_13588_length_265_cov_0.927711_1_plen_43_part_01
MTLQIQTQRCPALLNRVKEQSPLTYQLVSVGPPPLEDYPVLEI